MLFSPRSQLSSVPACERGMGIEKQSVRQHRCHVNALLCISPVVLVTFCPPPTQHPSPRTILILIRTVIWISLVRLWTLLTLLTLSCVYVDFKYC